MRAKCRKHTRCGVFDGGLLSSIDGQWRKFGVEINSVAAQRASGSGVDILTESWHDIDKLGQNFDVVVAIDVIEHTEAPLEFLSSLASVVLPGGCLMLSTGNLDAWSWHLMGSRYLYCVIPEHISFVSSRWYDFAASKLNLTIELCRPFSHSSISSLDKRLFEILLNLFYRISPKAFNTLRNLHRNSITATYAAKFDEIKEYPPPWGTARDHIFVVLRKPIFRDGLYVQVVGSWSGE